LGGAEGLSVWSIKDGNLAPRVFEPSFYTAIGFSHDGSMLVTGHSGGKIVLWDPRTFKPIRTLDNPSHLTHRLVTDVLVVDSSKTVFSRNEQQMAQFFRTTLNEDTARFLRYPHTIVHGFSNTKERLLAADARGGNMLDVWDISTGRILQTIEGTPDEITAVGFLLDGALLVISGKDGKLCVWSVQTGRLIQTVVLDGGMTALSTSPDGRLVAAAIEKSLRVWKINPQPPAESSGVLTELFTLPGASTEITSLAYRDQDRTIAFGRSDGKISLLRPSAHPRLMTWDIEGRIPAAVSFSPKGSTLAVLGADFSVSLWNTKDGTRSRVLMGASKIRESRPLPHGISFSPDGSALASLQPEGNVRFWDVKKGVTSFTINAHAIRADAFSFSPDGKTFATVGYELAVKLWNSQDGKQLGTLQKHHGFMRAVAFAPDGITLASSAVNKFNDEIKVWDTKSRREIHTLTTNTPTTYCLAYCGKNVLSSGHVDGSIRIWDAREGAIKKVTQLHLSTVTGLLSVPRSKILISSSKDGTIRLIDAESGSGLVTIYPIGEDDWVATTPQCLYDGTPAGIACIRGISNGKLISRTSLPSAKQIPGLVARVLERKLIVSN
jgi:WD40 repeat protein